MVQSGLISLTLGYMPAFIYTALDSSGNKISGDLECRNKAEAYRQLEAQSLSPVLVETRVDKSKPKKRGKELAKGPIPLTKKAIITLTEELADLLDAGLQLEQSLRVLEERQQDKSIKHVAGILREEIREGARFSVALKKASPSFDSLYRNLVAAGEASGALPEILSRLAVNQKQLLNLQQRTVSAMIYPAVVMLFCVVLLVVFSTVLMPLLTKLIKKGGQELPLVTEILIMFTDFINAWWWLMLIIAVVAGIAFKMIIGTKSGRLWWDKAKLNAPAIGPVISGRFFAQFAHSMSNLINNGVPLLNALKLLQRGTTNKHLQGQFNHVVDDVGEGISLSRALEKKTDSPASLVDRVAIGEQSGELGKAFAKAAVKYDEELDIHIKRLTTLLPMIMLIFVALIVGVIAYSIVTTLFGSMKGAGGRR